MKVAGLALALGAGACLSVEPVDPNKQTVAVVAGRVVRRDGTGVGGSSLTIQLLSEKTGASAQVIASVSGFDQDDGHFVQVFFVNGFLPQTGSTTIAVVAPLGSGLQRRDTSGIPVKLILGQQPTDTTYVEIILPPR